MRKTIDIIIKTSHRSCSLQCIFIYNYHSYLATSYLSMQSPNYWCHLLYHPFHFCDASTQNRAHKRIEKLITINYAYKGKWILCCLLDSYKSCQVLCPHTCMPLYKMDAVIWRDNWYQKLYWLQILGKFKEFFKTVR